ncbi:MAG: ATP-binding protein [Bacteroidota bacterium]
MVQGNETGIPALSPHELYYQLTVADNGIGFEPEHKDRIFQIFQRLHGKHKYPGTGIGLAIVKKIVENHNGIITATGHPDNGAAFTIYLPATPERVEVPQ